MIDLGPAGYVYMPERECAGARRQTRDDILQGFSGILQVDGYNRLLKRASQNVQLAYCWAHARRKLHDVTKASAAPIAQQGLKQVIAFYRVEADIKGQSADERLAARIERTKPKLIAFESWLTQSRAQVSADSPTGETLKSLLGDCCAFACQAVHHQILGWLKPVPRRHPHRNRQHPPLSVNASVTCRAMVERTIRPIDLNRKTALFAGHDAGAENWAMLASLIETCKSNAYITGILSAIVNGHKQSNIKALLPWIF